MLRLVVSIFTLNLRFCTGQTCSDRLTIDSLWISDTIRESRPQTTETGLHRGRTGKGFPKLHHKTRTCSRRKVSFVNIMALNQHPPIKIFKED